VCQSRCRRRRFGDHGETRGERRSWEAYTGISSGLGSEATAARSHWTLYVPNIGKFLVALTADAASRSAIGWTDCVHGGSIRFWRPILTALFGDGRALLWANIIVSKWWPMSNQITYVGKITDPGANLMLLSN
jgi:hypothetical protein